MALALVGCQKGSSAAPFVCQRLYEVLGLAVGLRAVGSGEKMASIEPLVGFPEDFCSVA